MCSAPYFIMFSDQKKIIATIRGIPLTSEVCFWTPNTTLRLDHMDHGFSASQ